MKRIVLAALIPAFLVGCAAGNKSSYSVTPDVNVTVKDTRKKAKSPYVQQDAQGPVAGAAGGTSR
jgi:hypothetical protein